MRRLNYNRIKKEDFLQLSEDDLMLVTNPGRMGDEDGSYFVIRKNNKYIPYRVSGWMYGTQDKNPVSFQDMVKQFPKWEEAWKNYTNEDYDGKYNYVYMGFGNGLCIDKEIYEDFHKYLEYEASKNPMYRERKMKYGILFNSWEQALIDYTEDKKIELVQYEGTGLKCPNCNGRLVDIVYGMPTPETFEKSKNEELYLGGCVVPIGLEQPKYHCYNCEKNFYKNLVNYENTDSDYSEIDK